MFRQLIEALAALATAAVLAGGAAAADFEVHAGWASQLFPSFIVSTATIRIPEEALDEHENEQLLGDPQGLLGVSLSADEDDTPVTVTVSCDAIMEPSTFTGTLASAGTTYAIFPKIKYNYDALLRQRQAGPVTVTFAVTLGDGDEEDEEEVSQTLTLRSINDCPFTVVEDGDARDLSFVFAAYVNEDHPFVDKLLREGLNTGIVSSFSGYQADDEAEVYRQVYALWHALSQRDLRYSSITTTAAETDSISSQHVRLIDESINNAQANCVDGSVLLASLLRKVGIEPVLVMVPGHCYLAFQLDAAGEEIVGLETTLLGSEAGDAAEIDGLEDAVDEAWQQKNSWKTFAAALAMGCKDLQDNADRFAAKDDADYQLIGIAAARKIGILPLAFKSGEAFEAAVRQSKASNDEEDEE
jgi:hypothetical protein